MTEAGTSGRGRGRRSAVNGRKSNRSGYGYSLNRRGFSGRFEYGAETVRRSSEMVYRSTRGGGVTRRNVTFSGRNVRSREALRYY